MKIRVLIVVVGVYFYAYPVSAQWLQSTLPADYQITDILQSNSYIYVATSNYGIVKTQNFIDWSPSGSGISTTNVCEIISVVEQGSFITFYAATDAGAFRSTMLGYNWTPINYGITNLNLSTIYADGNFLFAGAYGTAYRSENFGQSWTLMTIGTSGQTVTCFFRNGTDLLAGLSGLGTYLYRSTDNGLTWQPYGSGLYEIQQIQKLGGELFAISGTVMYHSLDNGATWSPVGPGLVPGMNITDLFPDDNYLYVATLAGGYVQHADSTNFRLITAGMPLGGTNLTAVAKNDNWIVFGTLNNGLWYANPQILTEMPEPFLKPDELSLYPNPTDGEFFISKSNSGFSRSPDMGRFQVAVLDITGKTTKTYKSESGKSKDGFDISELPAGVYFVRIRYQDQWITRKLIKQ